MLTLQIETPAGWIDTVLNDFDTFLIDHAACERKASGMAMSMVTHYPDKPDLTKAMTNLAIEELVHFKQVLTIMNKRGILMTPDEKDPYVNQLLKKVRNSKQEYFLDRLLTAGIIEARGHERFDIVGQHQQDPDLKKFYTNIAKAEEKHHELFVDLALIYFPKEIVKPRLDELLDIEAAIVKQLPLRAAVH